MSDGPSKPSLAGDCSERWTSESRDHDVTGLQPTTRGTALRFEMLRRCAWLVASRWSAIKPLVARLGGSKCQNEREIGQREESKRPSMHAHHLPDLLGEL